VKPKAEPPSGRPREGEFSSPVTARRTARRASRPFLPSATSSPRPPQDHRARPSRIMPRGTPSPASTQLHRPPGCPPSFSISYLTPWPPARPQRSLCTWPHPAHLCCGGSRKGVSGLERSGEAETPFLKARRRATNHHRAGGQGVRLGVRLIDEHPDEHARQADGFACALGLPGRSRLIIGGGTLKQFSQGIAAGEPGRSIAPGRLPARVRRVGLRRSFLQRAWIRLTCLVVTRRHVGDTLAGPNVPGRGSRWRRFPRGPSEVSCCPDHRCGDAWPKSRRRRR
jgi:hypothetical protein